MLTRVPLPSHSQSVELTLAPRLLSPADTPLLPRSIVISSDRGLVLVCDGSGATLFYTKDWTFTLASVVRLPALQDGHDHEQKARPLQAVGRREDGW